MTTKDATIYTTYGSVRRGCGHRHTTLTGADRCLQRDQRACASLGGGSYSDRAIVVWTPGARASDRDWERLSEDDRDRLWDIRDRAW